jgi:hypothetical protein
VVNVQSAEFGGKLKKFGKIRFVMLEWWPESPKFALLKYEIAGKMQEKGVRIDLDKRAILDDIPHDDTATEEVKKSAEEIWSAAVTAVRTEIWPKYQRSLESVRT